MKFPRFLPPTLKAALTCFISMYLMAYYIPLPVIIITFMLLLFLILLVWIFLCLVLFSLCSALRSFKFLRCVPRLEHVAATIKYGSYAACILLGLFMGQKLRQRAELLQNHRSLGMTTEQVQAYFGRVLRDAVPSDDGSFRFAVQLFAASDGRHLLSSAQGRVFIRAAALNPMPALGQLVAVRTPIIKLRPDHLADTSILFSSAAQQTIQLLGPKDFTVDMAKISPTSPIFEIHKAAAYSLKQASRFDALRDDLGKTLGKPSASLAWQLFWQKLCQWRSAVRRNLFTSLNQLFPMAGRDLFLALLFGISEDLPDQVKENFRLSGVAHILALSGFHVGILASIASFLLRPLLGLRRSLLASSLILLAYLFLVGPLPSLTRAIFMFLLFSGSKFFLRHGDGFSIWTISALLQTQAFPAVARTLSFQLSYAALLGLVLFAGRGNTLALLTHHKLLYRAPRSFPIRLFFMPLQFIFQGIAMTLAVLLCSAPILIANFGQIQWIGLLASLVETPIITLYMWISLLLWPLAYLLQNHEALLTPLQAAYQQVYYASLAPMEFFAQAKPWQFYDADGNLLPRALVLYLLCSASLLALLYRYELGYFIRKQQNRLVEKPS